VGKTFKTLVTEPRVTGGGSDQEGKLLSCKRSERRLASTIRRHLLVI
jgi:hypothetical protein